MGNGDKIAVVVAVAVAVAVQVAVAVAVTVDCTPYAEHPAADSPAAPRIKQITVRRARENNFEIKPIPPFLHSLMVITYYRIKNDVDSS